MRSSSLPSMIIIFIFDHPAYLWMAIPEIFKPAYLWWLPHGLACEQLFLRSSSQLTFSSLHMARPVNNYSWDLPAYFWWPAHDPACGWVFPRSSSLPLVGLHMTQPVDDYSQDLPAYLWWPPLGLACGWHQPVHSSDRWSHPPAAGPSSPDKVPADTALHGPGSTAHL